MSEIQRYKEKISKLSQEEFFLFFNNNKNEEDSWKEGEQEFESEIIAPMMETCNFLDKTSNKNALEIGYGGGRLLAPACKMFNRVYGVDIHERPQLVVDKLLSFGIKNFVLFGERGDFIPLAPRTVDFVYSYIVFQHLETIQVTIQYLKEIFSVLNYGGHAIIYFGRAFTNETNTYVDKIKKPVNHTNIRLSEGYAVGLAMGVGFEVLKVRVSKSGTQFALILKKL